MTRWRILTVANCPLDAQLGSGYVIDGYASRLRARGHEVTTLEPRDYEWLPNLRGAKRLRTLCGYSAAVLRAAKRAEYDIVELWGGASWWAIARLARRARRPLVVARSNGLEPHYQEAMLQHAIEQRPAPVSLRGLFERVQRTEQAFRRADGLTLVSDFDRRYAERMQYQPGERTLTLENPLLANWLGQSPAPERPLTVGFCGSWLPNKGATLLLEALASVLRDQPQWRARLIGLERRGGLPALPEAVARRIEFVPHVPRERLMEEYRQMAILAMPSAFESFGLVAAEAMACGCALAASPTGFAADLIPAKEAWVIEPRTAKAWAEGLTILMTDEARRRAIAQAGWARVQELRWPEAVDRLEAFYARLLAARSRAR